MLISGLERVDSVAAKVLRLVAVSLAIGSRGQASSLGCRLSVGHEASVVDYLIRQHGEKLVDFSDCYLSASH